MTIALQAVQERDWRLLHDAITSVLDLYGVKNPIRGGDYWLLDENWGRFSQQLEFQNLDLFRYDILAFLQGLLTKFPDWYITIRVDVVGKENEWPGMGVVIYPDRIVDDLQRGFLPARFQTVRFGVTAAEEADQVADRVRKLMNPHRRKPDQDR